MLCLTSILTTRLIVGYIVTLRALRQSFDCWLAPVWHESQSVHTCEIQESL